MAGFQRAALLICCWVVRRRLLGAFLIAVPDRTLTMVVRRGTPVRQRLGNRRQTVESWSWIPCISLETPEKLSSELRTCNGFTLDGRKYRSAQTVVFKGSASLLLIFWSKVRILHGPPIASNDPGHSEGHRNAVPFFVALLHGNYFVRAVFALAAAASAASCAAVAAAFAERAASALAASK